MSLEDLDERARTCSSCSLTGTTEVQWWGPPGPCPWCGRSEDVQLLSLGSDDEEEVAPCAASTATA